MWCCKMLYPHCIPFTTGADANAKDIWENTPLIYACQYGHSEVADLLIGHGQYGHSEVADLLIGHGEQQC